MSTENGVFEMKKNTILFLAGQLTIFVLSLLIRGTISLLNYVDYSFYVGGLLVLAGGIVYILRTGSFDFFTKSMRKVLSPKHTQEGLESMRTPSEVFSVSPVPFFAAGIPILLLMLIALALY